MIYKFSTKFPEVANVAIACAKLKHFLSVLEHFLRLLLRTSSAKYSNEAKTNRLMLRLVFFLSSKPMPVSLS